MIAQLMNKGFPSNECDDRGSLVDHRYVAHSRYCLVTALDCVVKGHDILTGKIGIHSVSNR